MKLKVLKPRNLKDKYLSDLAKITEIIKPIDYKFSKQELKSYTLEVDAIILIRTNLDRELMEQAKKFKVSCYFWSWI